MIHNKVYLIKCDQTIARGEIIDHAFYVIYTTNGYKCIKVDQNKGDCDMNLIQGGNIVKWLVFSFNYLVLQNTLPIPPGDSTIRTQLHVVLILTL